MAVENAVKAEPFGEFALRGIRWPLLAYNGLSARADGAFFFLEQRASLE
jgi:hypothetical protein